MKTRRIKRDHLPVFTVRIEISIITVNLPEIASQFGEDALVIGRTDPVWGDGCRQPQALKVQSHLCLACYSRLTVDCVDGCGEGDAASSAAIIRIKRQDRLDARRSLNALANRQDINIRALLPKYRLNVGCTFRCIEKPLPAPEFEPGFNCLCYTLWRVRQKCAITLPERVIIC